MSDVAIEGLYKLIEACVALYFGYMLRKGTQAQVATVAKVEEIKADTATVKTGMTAQDKALEAAHEKLEKYSGAVNGALTAFKEDARRNAETVLRETVAGATATATALVLADTQQKLALANQHAIDTAQPVLPSTLKVEIVPQPPVAGVVPVPAPANAAPPTEAPVPLPSDPLLPRSD